MDKIFAKRRQDWYEQNIKYLRYVFNDHFVLFLMILIGAFVVQYANYLNTHTATEFEKYIVIFLVSIVSLFMGRLATFLESADKAFLLAKEEEIDAYLTKAVFYSMIMPVFSIITFTIIAFPLLRYSWIFLVVWMIVLIVIKFILYSLTLNRFHDKSGMLKWDELIDYENNRQNTTLRFFALFTNVKGLKSGSHRRKYLDFLLPKTKRTYDYLYMRAFLRSGDYLNLTLRILLLQVLAIVFIPNSLLAMILVVVLSYLLVFQLMALRENYDYQLFTRLYPVKDRGKDVGLRSVLLRVVAVLTLVQVVLGLIFMSNKWYVIAFVLMNLILLRIYIKARLRKNKSLIR
ncbi:MAG: ABC transporter permease [Streptococcaceae bacterium]|nr:ABC transporter permease [Streptococcaceae bacterium]MCL2681310.1 ABC transporter permease [Streptococcaceae bacterium]